MQIFHNPHCTKSQKTLALLQSLGESPQIISYLTQVPSIEDLKGILLKLKLRPRDIVRKNEAVFQDLHLDLDNDLAVLAALVEHPILIERPIVVTATDAVIGRPPENVRRLFEK